MRIQVNGKGMEVSPYVADVVTKRVKKLERYFNADSEVQVMLSMFRGRHVAEITIPFGGVVFRAEEATGDIYASIDNSCNKIERQVEKYRTRFEKRNHEATIRTQQVIKEPGDKEQEIPKIVKTKKFAVKPMSCDEAIMQMDLLGHQFFVFTNADSNQVNVLYKRLDGNLGLIEPEYI
ncbi:MAG: ribosome-associated translation inhibitor RaiA [Clostridiaceae bacterium]|jgi:putative sigma-54 modulation protein|nr:ribosome-associated translation inhibitor RaiA [Clostridiaceae bacterium]